MNSSIYKDALKNILNEEYIQEREQYVTKNNMQPIIEGETKFYTWDVVIEENSNKYIIRFIDKKEMPNG